MTSGRPVHVPHGRAREGDEPVVQEGALLHPEPSPPLRSPHQPPTPHELVVLELVAQGLSSRQVAERLWVSRQTVTYHIGNLLSKFDVQTRTGLVARAYASGVLSPGFWPPRLRSPYAESIDTRSQPRARKEGSGR